MSGRYFQSLARACSARNRTATLGSAPLPSRYRFPTAVDHAAPPVALSVSSLFDNNPSVHIEIRKMWSKDTDNQVLAWFSKSITHGRGPARTRLRSEQGHPIQGSLISGMGGQSGSGAATSVVSMSSGSVPGA
jgi:hypothetical protein